MPAASVRRSCTERRSHILPSPSGVTLGYKINRMLARRTILASLFAVSLFAQDPVAAARQWRTDHQGEILKGFKALLAIPNVAADRAALERNANTLAGLLTDRHFATKLLSVVDAPSIVWAERK